MRAEFQLPRRLHAEVRQRPPRLRRSLLVASFDAVGRPVAADVVAACRPRASRAGVV
jgi:hypothetical protein